MRSSSILKVLPVPEWALGPTLKAALLGEEQGSLPLVLRRDRIFILPTKQGLYWFLAILVLLIGASNYNNNVTFLLTFYLAGISCLQMIYTHRNLRGLAILSWRVRPVFAGEKACITLCLDPMGRPRKGINIKIKAWEGSCLKDIGPGPTQVSIPLETSRRGYVRIGPILVESTYPFGLFRAWSRPNPGIELVIYPRPSAEPCPFSLSGEATEKGGSAREGLEELSGIRQYLPQDPLKNIAWKVSFKGLGLQSKRFDSSTSTTGNTVILDWWSLATEEKEDKISRLTKCILDLDKKGTSYALNIPGTRIPIGSGKRHKERCLTALALF